MKFGLENKNNNSNNNNNNNEKNQKLTEEINQLIPREMQQQIITAIREYKSGNLILFRGVHKPQFSEAKKGFAKVFDYMAENGPNNSPETKAWRTFAGFVCLLMKDYQNFVINKDEYKQLAEEVTYTLVVGIKADGVHIFKPKWDKFYNNGDFNSEYLDELALQSVAAAYSASQTNMTP